MGRPRKESEIPVNKISEIAQLGCTNEEIATLCGFSVDTLTRNYAELLDKGRAERKRKLRQWQWDSARKGNVTMQIWLGKQELGQSDKADSTPPSPIIFRVNDESNDQPVVN